MNAIEWHQNLVTIFQTFTALNYAKKHEMASNIYRTMLTKLSGIDKRPRFRDYQINSEPGTFKN